MAIKPSEKIAALKAQKAGITQKIMKVNMNLQDIQNKANDELTPIANKIAKAKTMRTELLKLEEVPQQNRDELDRQLKEEIATDQKVHDDRLAYYRNLANIEQEDLKAIQAQDMELGAQMDLWMRLGASFPEDPVPAIVPAP